MTERYLKSPFSQKKPIHESDEPKNTPDVEMQRENTKETKNKSETSQESLITIEAGMCTQASEAHPDRNEDNGFTDANKQIFAVFDGLGGHAGGREASTLAKKIIEQRTQELSTKTFSLEEAKAWIKSTLQEANAAIQEEAKNNPIRKNMGTTVTLAYLWKDETDDIKLLGGSIGDSRLYLKSKVGNLKQLSMDDGDLEYALSTNKLTKDEYSLCKNHLDTFKWVEDLTRKERGLLFSRHLMTNYLGNQEFHFNAFEHEINSEDKLLLCTDGIHDNLTSDEIEKLIDNEIPSQELAKNIVEEALKTSQQQNDRSKPDDMTAIIINIKKDKK